jgi:hypothetical protein
VNKIDIDKKENVAPFVIEKNYGKAKIIFVNAIGYFDAILGESFLTNITNHRNKHEYFETIANISRIIGIPENDLYVKKDLDQIPSLRTTKIIGDIKIYPGQTITINSSFLLFPDGAFR